MARDRVIISSQAATAPRERSYRVDVRQAWVKTCCVTSSASSGRRVIRSASE